MTSVLIAPDKFRSSLTSSEAAAAMREGVLAAIPDAVVHLAAIADGGEGTIDALISTGATINAVDVSGPLGVATTALIARRHGTAFVESAQALRSSLIDAANPFRALQANSYGLGQMITSATSDFPGAMVVGLGGTSTTDGGYGMAHALGFAVLDKRGRPLARDTDAMVSAWTIEGDFSGEIVAATDVDSPLLGPLGAARVFGPQKGATHEQIAILEHRLEIWRDALMRSFGVDVSSIAGGGAAGGIAAGLVALTGAPIRSGAEIVLDLLDIPARIPTFDFVITGEGSLDLQTLSGKGPALVARLARASHVPIYAIAGVADVPAVESAFDGISQIALAARSGENSFTDAAAIVSREAQAIASRWLINRNGVGR